MSTETITQKIEQADFPCIMAQTVLAQSHMHRISVGDMTDLSHENITRLLNDLYPAISSIKNAKGYHSIIVEFAEPTIYCEQQFEMHLWQLLQALHNVDQIKYEWNQSVSSDPHSAKFSYSLMGEAFYIIGMHPKASRKARQTERPTLVLNLHEQFEKIRATGNYSKVRDKIRMRDEAYCGSVNPMLQDFGAASEAMQYSGRNVDKTSWQCPFTAATKKS